MDTIKKMWEKPLIRQMIKFSVVGVLSFLVQVLCMYLLTKFMTKIPVITDFSDDTHTLIATPIAFVVSLLFNYILSILFVFKKRKDVEGKQVFAIFVVLNLIALLLNWLLMWVLVSAVFNFHRYVALVIATVLVMIYNFITRKIFVEDHSDRNEKKA